MTWPPANGSLRPAAKPHSVATRTASRLNHGSAVRPWRSPITIAGTPGAGDDRSDSACERAPGEMIDQRVFERAERRAAGAGQFDQPLGVVASGMGNRQQHGELAARWMDEGRGEQGFCQNPSHNRTRQEALQRAKRSIASSKTESFSA